MKFVILDNRSLPEFNGVRGPILTPRFYDIHLVLRWIAAGIDIREVMEDGSYRKLEFNDERVMRRLALTWGVYPVKAEVAGNTDEVIENSIETSKNAFIYNNWNCLPWLYLIYCNSRFRGQKEMGRTMED